MGRLGLFHYLQDVTSWKDSENQETTQWETCTCPDFNDTCCCHQIQKELKSFMKLDICALLVSKVSLFMHILHSVPTALGRVYAAELFLPAPPSSHFFLWPAELKIKTIKLCWQRPPGLLTPRCCSWHLSHVDLLPDRFLLRVCLPDWLKIKCFI